ncbi:MAG: acetate/CoA ligase [Desulfomicrobiaceae bacterium]|jgi:acetyl-CoA synthetase|nr:acetate/CoA ligase [Desulfomicrobiaceae bacterium]
MIVPSNAERVFRPLPQLVIEANVNPHQLSRAHAAAAQDPLAYWEEAAQELEWFRKWDTILDTTAPSSPRWFVGAQTNIVHNALDRHIATGVKNKLALIWEGEAGDTRKYTYYEVYREVNKLANALRSLGIGKGDRVLLFLPLLPQTAFAMLATAKIGAVHCAVFPGFSAKALRSRIQELRPRLVITADGFYRGGRLVALKSMVDEALETGCDFVEGAIVVRRAGLDTPMNESRDLDYDAVVRRERWEAATEVMLHDDPLFILTTSEDGGRRKAVVHGHAGYMVALARTLLWLFDIKPTDIFWCTSDMAWITGHSYVLYGPMLAGTTTVMYEGHPLYPQADRMWDIVDRYGITILYTAPTIIRMLMRYGDQYPAMHDLSTLRLLASAGEALGGEAWLWLYKNVGHSRCPLLDTWWQTETGCCMISPFPVSVLKPGSVHRPLPGISADIVDAHGASVPSGVVGRLVITQPWPSMPLECVHEAGEAPSAWQNGQFDTGDLAVRDEDGLIHIQGRADAVLNIAGHRLSCAEIELALTTHKAVAAAAVIGVPDRIKGEVAKAFVVLTPEFAALEDPGEIIRLLRQHVRKEIGPVAVLRSVVFVEAIPRAEDGAPDRAALKAQESE